MLLPMQMTGTWWPISVVMLVAAGVLVASSPDVADAAPMPLAPSALMTLAADADQPVEKQVGGATKTLLHSFRRSFRLMRWGVQRAFILWAGSFKRILFSVGVAIMAALADGGLISTWRSAGLRTAVNYSGMMLYVHARLLFSNRVHLAPKLLLLGSIVYGAVRRDFVPDRATIPGRLDDIVLIIIATRTFIYACPEALVSEFADRAVDLRRRVPSLPFRTR